MMGDMLKTMLTEEHVETVRVNDSFGLNSPDNGDILNGDLTSHSKVVYNSLKNCIF